METFVCPQNTPCPPPGTATTGYLRLRMGHGQRYTQMYTTKELQTGEYWDASVSTGLEMYDFDARFYDPQMGRWFVPDPAEQFSNPYLAMGNNPVVYVDPDGEFVQFIIGAVIGGISGWQIGNEMGAEGGEMLGYIFGGAAIGALTGGVASGVSAAGGGAFAAGTAAGAVGGAGFSGLATNWNVGAMMQGTIFGAISGGVGAGVGAAIGGGAGAFAGGAVGSAINTALYGGSWEDIGKSALIGGGMAFGLYHTSSYIGWKFQGGNKWGDVDISYRQYTKMQADFQRSRFWKKEYGGYLMNDGTIQRFTAEQRANLGINNIPDMPSDAKGMYHTHWAKPGVTYDVTPKGNIIRPGDGYRGPGSEVTTTRYHSPTDMLFEGGSFVINRYDGSYHPGADTYYTDYNVYRSISPPINRFVYSFYFWR